MAPLAVRGRGARSLTRQRALTRPSLAKTSAPAPRCVHPLVLLRHNRSAGFQPALFVYLRPIFLVFLASGAGLPKEKAGWKPALRTERRRHVGKANAVPLSDAVGLAQGGEESALSSPGNYSFAPNASPC